MDPEEISRQKDVLRQLVKVRDSIRNKYNLLKRNTQESERVIKKIWEPVVTPLQKLVEAKAIPKTEVKVEEKERVKKQEANDEEAEEDEWQDVNSEPEDTPLFEHYLMEFPPKELDSTFGVRRLAGDKLKVGDSEIEFSSNSIHVGAANYPSTTGLLELLFKKTPDESSITIEDLDNYSKILLDTNAHRKSYKPDGDVRVDKSLKFTKYISKAIGYEPPEHMGTGLPTHPENDGMDYWDDPNELVDRLRLLIASQAAGNSSLSNEIISIIEELREAGIVH